MPCKRFKCFFGVRDDAVAPALDELPAGDIPAVQKLVLRVIFKAFHPVFERYRAEKDTPDLLVGQSFAQLGAVLRFFEREHLSGSCAAY